MFKIKVLSFTSTVTQACEEVVFTASVRKYLCERCKHSHQC